MRRATEPDWGIMKATEDEYIHNRHIRDFVAERKLLETFANNVSTEVEGEDSSFLKVLREINKQIP